MYSIMKASSVVEPYVEERHVEIVYAQWKLYMYRFVIASCIRVQRAKTSNHWYAIDITLVIADKLLTTVYGRIKIAASTQFKVGDGTREQIQNNEKGYSLSWTTEVFKIIKMQKTNPVTYTGGFLRKTYCQRILRISVASSH